MDNLDRGHVNKKAGDLAAHLFEDGPSKVPRLPATESDAPSILPTSVDKSSHFVRDVPWLTDCSARRGGQLPHYPHFKLPRLSRLTGDLSGNQAERPVNHLIIIYARKTR